MKQFVRLVCCVLLLTILDIGCKKKACYDCIVKDSAGKVFASVQTCDASTRDGFIDNYSGMDAECTAY